MKKYAFLILVSLFFLISCEEGGEETLHEWPTTISGCNININVVNDFGASVDSGLTIRYTFSAPDQQVSGTNPETGVTYTASSYGYGYSDNIGVITLYYGDVAYERYTLTATSESGGIYESESYDGLNTASSDGTYSFSCF